MPRRKARLEILTLISFVDLVLEKEWGTGDAITEDELNVQAG